TKYIRDLEEYRDQLLEVLSPELEFAVTRELSKDHKMKATMNGGKIIPDSGTIITPTERSSKRQLLKEGKKSEAKNTKRTRPQGRNGQKFPLSQIIGKEVRCCHKAASSLYLSERSSTPHESNTTTLSSTSPFQTTLFQILLLFSAEP
ncbi:hypothetical protein VP01_3870g1, partial [Puccinia sorghi]